jgi:putative membrane protein
MFSQAGLNASLNAASALLLSTGYVFIRRRRVRSHKVCMILALCTSVAFLVSYVIYHVRVGSVHFQGHGWIRPVYFSILISHTLLAAAIVPLAGVTVFRAWHEQFDRHRRIARWTLPLWLYVSVTGVVIYVLLYQIYAPLRGAGL